MLVKVERSGGFAGISNQSEMNSDDLPASLQTVLAKLMKNDIKPSKPLKFVPKGSADHFSYRITVVDGSNHRVIECSQYDLQDDLKSLVTYMEKHNGTKG